MKAIILSTLVLSLMGCVPTHNVNKTYQNKEYIAVKSGKEESTIEKLCFSSPPVTCFAEGSVLTYSAGTIEVDTKKLGVGGAESFSFWIYKLTNEDKYQLIFTYGAVQKAALDKREILAVTLDDGTNILENFEGKYSTFKSEYRVVDKLYTQIGGTSGFYKGIELQTTTNNTNTMFVNKQQARKILAGNEIKIKYLTSSEGLVDIIITPTDSMRKVASFTF